ncbi:MAG: RNA polymerase sigma factor [Bacteroidota bacterium]
MNAHPRPDEQQLIQECLAGKQAAQWQLYKKYAKAMYHTVVRMVVQPSDAEDILQDTFVKVFQKLEAFKGESTLGAWIKRIAINTALSHIQKNGRIRFLQVQEQYDLAVPPPSFEASSMDMRSIHQAIKQLPEGCRVVFNLYLLEGYQHQEIAQILHISESTSKSQYQRARRLLQQSLKKNLALSG